MDEIMFYFSKALHDTLKSKVFGRVFCRIEDDELKVKISHRSGVCTYYIKSNMQDALYSGITADMIAEEVLRKHRRNIKYEFFKQEKIEETEYEKYGREQEEDRKDIHKKNTYSFRPRRSYTNGLCRVYRRAASDDN